MTNKHSAISILSGTYGVMYAGNMWEYCIRT
jgi:hypothetical protein